MTVLLQELGLIADLIFDTTHQIVESFFWRYIFRIGRVGVCVTLWELDFDILFFNLELNFGDDSARRVQVDFHLSLFVNWVGESKWLLIFVDIICGQKPTPYWRNIFFFVAAGGMIVPMRIGLIRNRPLLSFDHRNFEKTFFIDYFFSYFSKY